MRQTTVQGSDVQIRAVMVAVYPGKSFTQLHHGRNARYRDHLIDTDISIHQSTQWIWDGRDRFRRGSFSVDLAKVNVTSFGSTLAAISTFVPNNVSLNFPKVYILSYRNRKPGIISYANHATFCKSSCPPPCQRKIAKPKTNTSWRRMPIYRKWMVVMSKKDWNFLRCRKEFIFRIQSRSS
jgi:hypothetical protein